MPGIIWLASYPKSGNTWLRAFLANYLANRVEPLHINELPNYCLGDSMMALYMQYSGLTSDQLTPKAIAKLRPRVHLWMAQSSRNNVFVKTHSPIGAEEGTALITPDATVGAVYVVRNPFDVAISYSHHYQVGLDQAVEALCNNHAVLEQTDKNVRTVLSSWDLHVRSWVEADGLARHVMRYEDMQAAPLKSFGKLMKFLKIKDDMPRLKRAIAHASFKELKKQEADTTFVEARPDGKAKFFREGKVGAWREVLSGSQIERLTSGCEASMRRWGYLTDKGEIAA